MPLEIEKSCSGRTRWTVVIKHTMRRAVTTGQEMWTAERDELRHNTGWINIRYLAD